MHGSINRVNTLHSITTLPPSGWKAGIRDSPLSDRSIVQACFTTSLLDLVAIPRCPKQHDPTFRDIRRTLGRSCFRDPKTRLMNNNLVEHRLRADHARARGFILRANRSENGPKGCRGGSV